MRFEHYLCGDTSRALAVGEDQIEIRLGALNQTHKRQLAPIKTASDIHDLRAGYFRDGFRFEGHCEFRGGQLQKIGERLAPERSLFWSVKFDHDEEMASFCDAMDEVTCRLRAAGLTVALNDQRVFAKTTDGHWRFGLGKEPADMDLIRDGAGAGEIHPQREGAVPVFFILALRESMDGNISIVDDEQQPVSDLFSLTHPWIWDPQFTASELTKLASDLELCWPENWGWNQDVGLF